MENDFNVLWPKIKIKHCNAAKRPNNLANAVNSNKSTSSKSALLRDITSLQIIITMISINIKHVIPKFTKVTT